MANYPLKKPSTGDIVMGLATFAGIMTLVAVKLGFWALVVYALLKVSGLA